MSPQALIPDSESDQEPAALEAWWSSFRKGSVPRGLSVTARATALGPWREVLFLSETCLVASGGWTQVYLKPSNSVLRPHFLTRRPPLPAQSSASSSPVSYLRLSCVIRTWGGIFLRARQRGQKRGRLSRYLSTRKSRPLKSFSHKLVGFLTGPEHTPCGSPGVRVRGRRVWLNEALPSGTGMGRGLASSFSETPRGALPNFQSLEMNTGRRFTGGAVSQLVAKSFG